MNWPDSADCVDCYANILGGMSLKINILLDYYAHNNSLRIRPVLRIFAEPVEAEFLCAGGMEHPVQDSQPLIAAEGVRPDAQGFEVGQHIRLDTFQPGLGLLQTVRLHAEGDVLGLGQAVVALGELAFQHIRIFFPDGVESVLLVGDMDGLALFLHIGGLVEEGELDADGRIKI